MVVYYILSFVACCVALYFAGNWVVGGLSRIGRGVTIGIGATLVERLQIGDHAFIGAGAVVLRDVGANLLVFGAPAKVRKRLASPAGR